jgi:hypothetical protein
MLLSTVIQGNSAIRPRGGNRFALDLDAPFGSRNQSRDDLQQRGLSAAGRTEQADELSVAHVEIDIGERKDVGIVGEIAFGEALDEDHRPVHFFSFSHPGYPG